MTIKDYVLERFAKGDAAFDIWRGAQKAFPFKCVSWLYVLRLKRSVCA